MRHAIVFFAASIMASCTLQAQLVQPPGQKQKLKSMLALVRDWCDALNQNDVNQQLSFYGNNDVVQVITSDGVLLRGPKAIRDAYTEANATVEVYNSRSNKTYGHLTGDSAIVTFEHKFCVRTLLNDQRVSRHIRTVMFLTNHNGEWKISSEHSSPIYGIAATKQLDTPKH